MSEHKHFADLIDRAAPLPPIRTAVVAPEEPNSLGGALLGAEATLIEPILVGDAAKIKAAAKTLGKDISTFELIDIDDHKAAAAASVALVHEGRASCVMKGQLHTSEFLGAIVKRDIGLRTGRKLTHCFVTDIPGQDRLITITDAAINVAPDLETKADIVQNAIELVTALGIEKPKVAIMAAVETVNPAMQDTLDAAALAQMWRRGQIKGGVVDGPFAMDNAVNTAAAKIKKIDSPVAGVADVLVMPEIQAGNLVYKALGFLGGAQIGGLVLGAKVPVILTSRADDDAARLASCALAVHYQNRHKPS
ncbi:bifunctional enoyl-CoA hydratase/phosphate acetyltransferase [Alphaproteobacteria bacterium KMM 3653]|uniref:Bifunctional enoyl-CoA hydratase/phosphate acetyltransferase n=1 Tax=Harenicola maris TaxID=2841044 RepID=A0AAP2CMR3_9RHOB|nr:bifunctional enoyl-CoA hydratase/phosphate acetyltransferase [Harenicola maris]